MIIALLPLQISGVTAAIDNSATKATSDNSISQPITLSLEAAVEKAINNDTSIKSLDLSLKRLWRVNDQNATFTVMDASVQKMLEKLDNYLILFDRKAKSDRGEKTELLNTNEQNELLDCKEVFGDIPPPYSKEMMFDSYTQSTAFPQYSNWLRVQELKNSRDIMKAHVKNVIWTTYKLALYIQEMNDVRMQSLETMEKQYKLLQLQYEKGLVSELDIYQCQVSIDKERLELKKREREIENYKMELKNLCGIPISQKLELSSTELPVTNRLLPFDTYYKKACENRDEIVYPMLEVKVLTRELDILNGYKKDPYSFDKTELNEQIEDAKLSVTEGLEAVTSDIQWAYADVSAIELNMDISKKNADNAKAELSIMETKYKQGQVKLLELWDARYSANSAELLYRADKRDFAYASYELDLASGLGPKYKHDEEAKGIAK